MGVFEKYICLYNLDVLMLYIFNFQVIFICYISLDLVVCVII